MDNNLEFMEAFKPKTNWVKEFEHWIIVIREDQVTLGDCIISLKRCLGSLGDMSIEEATEFPKVIQWYEERCVDLFGAVKFNYIAAMMRDNFAHLHAFPRYNSPISKYELEWLDERWPRVIQFEPRSTSEDVLQLIISEMRE